jgi:hypothetical protein
MNTVALDLISTKSSILLTQAQSVQTGDTLNVLIVITIVVLFVVVRLMGGAFRPFAEVVRVAFAALGAVVLSVVVLIMLIVALVVSAR